MSSVTQSPDTHAQQQLVQPELPLRRAPERGRRAVARRLCRVHHGPRRAGGRVKEARAGGPAALAVPGAAEGGGVVLPGGVVGGLHLEVWAACGVRVRVEARDDDARVHGVGGARAQQQRLPWWRMGRLDWIADARPSG